MKKGFVVTEALLIAVLAFLSAVVTEKESDGAISKYIGYEDTKSVKCQKIEKSYPKIYTGRE